MQPDEQKMLESLLKISEQNNRILRHIRREAIWGRVIHILYWVAILAISFGTYYYLKPYIGQATQIIQSRNLNQNMPR